MPVKPCINARVCVRQLLIRCAHVCIVSGGGRFEHLLSIVTLHIITQILIVYL